MRPIGLTMSGLRLSTNGGRLCVVRSAGRRGDGVDELLVKIVVVVSEGSR